MAHPPARQPAVFLFGPTAVGKTSLLELLNNDLYEVVSADSLQVYRRLDIGTAKPAAELRSRLPHHLVDIIDPTERFDVGAFVTLANQAILDIGSRDRVPVVSGGAGFYLKHLLYGLPAAPASTPEARELVRAQLASRGLPALFERLNSVDPATAQRVGPADEYRITRALEVFEVSGRPLSEFAPPASPRTDLSIRLIGLTRPRTELHRRIAARVSDMFNAGLRSEVETLVSDGLGVSAPGMRGIGYQEFFGPDGSLRPQVDDAEIAAQIRTDTRRYCKRQITFFRGLPNVAWYSAAEVAPIAAEMLSFVRAVSPALLDR